MTAVQMPQLRHAASLTLTLAAREIKAQYSGTVFGRLWSLVNPLVTIAVYTIVFGLIFRGVAPVGDPSGIDSFAMWIAVGVITWTYLSGAIARGMSALVGNAGLLEKVYFPRSVLIVSTVISTSVTFLTEAGVLVIILSFIGGPQVLLWVPLAIVFTVLLAMFSTGISLMLSIAVVRFRDIEHIWGLFNQVWMYASGVIFPIALVEDAAETLYRNGVEWNGAPLPLVEIFRLNPAEQFLEAFRSLLYDYAMPSAHVWVLCIAWSVSALVVGSLIFGARQARIVEDL